MTRKAKLLKQAIEQPQNLTFKDLCKLAQNLGFSPVRTQGSHHIYSHASVLELVNLQDYHGKAKPYQVRQLIKLAEKYGLSLGDDHE